MKTRTLFAFAAIMTATAVCGSLVSAQNLTSPGNIVAVASESGDFTILVTALKAAGLVETLQGKGPFTVFAPTDEAFKKLPEGTLQDLLKPENIDKLTKILTYHVVPGKVMASDVKTMEAKTVNGQTLNITAGTDGVKINNANVIKTDIPASNGVIHAVDTVILPPAPEKKPGMEKPKDHPAH